MWEDYYPPVVKGKKRMVNWSVLLKYALFNAVSKREDRLSLKGTIFFLKTKSSTVTNSLINSMSHEVSVNKHTDQITDIKDY